MEKNCLYCEVHFTTTRSNKKYCSDNCKQMAYFKRNGFVLSGGTKPEGFKYNESTVVKEQITKYVAPQRIVKNEVHNIPDSTVKYVSHSPSEKCEKNNSVVVTSEKSAENNTVLIEAMLNRFMESMEQKFNQTIENAKQELSVKYGSMKNNQSSNEKENTKQNCNQVAFNGLKQNSQTEPKKNYCKPSEGIVLNSFQKLGKEKENKKSNPIIGFKEAPENHQVKFVELHDNDENVDRQDLFEVKQNKELENEEEVETAHIEWEEENEDSETEETEEEKRESIEKDERIHELEKELRELKIEYSSITSRATQEEKYEEDYEWIESKIIKRIENNYVAQNHQQHFSRLLSNWNYPQLTSVSWINVRLRCLIESTIRLSNFSSIDKHTLFCITDAFNRLVKSNAYKMLPENYPYMELIKDLCIKLNQVAKNNSDAETIKFVLPLDRKAKLIALRNEMVKFIPAMKFSEIDFIEENILHALKTEDDNEIKKSDWRIRYQAMKRAEQRKVA